MRDGLLTARYHLPEFLTQVWGKWRQQLDEAFSVFDIELVFLVGCVDKNHELGDGGIELEPFDVLAHCFHGFMVNLVQVAIVFRHQILVGQKTVNPV